MGNQQLAWNSSQPGARGKCVGGQSINWGLIVPVAVCGTLTVALVATLVWLWFRSNKERLYKSSRPPGARPACAHGCLPAVAPHHPHTDGASQEPAALTPGAEMQELASR